VTASTTSCNHAAQGLPSEDNLTGSPFAATLESPTARRAAAGLLLALFVVVSWYPFEFDPPIRAGDVAVDASGGWVFSGASLATSSQPPTWLDDAIRASRLEINLEVSSTDPRQTGPARILAITRDTRSHNLMVGQDGPDLVVRVRRPGTDELGRPTLRVPDVFATSAWRRIEVRVDRRVEVVVEGTPAATDDPSGIPLDQWDDDQVLTLGNEPSWDRGWEGVIRQASVVTADGATDLLANGLTRTWGNAWVWPDRLAEGQGRPMGERLLVWALHFGLAAILLATAVTGWPDRSAQSIMLLWSLLVVTVNAGKIMIGGRHPSLVTVLLQLVGGLLGAWVARRYAGPRPDASSS
jgi:hypothetical protein